MTGTRDGGGGGASRSTDPASGTSSATDVSLREYLMQAIDGRFRLLTSSVDEHARQSRFYIAAVSAFGLFAWFQTKEHLESLNHEAKRLDVYLQSTVPQGTYNADEQRRKEDQNRITLALDEVTKKVAQAATKEEVQHDSTASRRAGIGTGTSVVAACVGLIIVVLAVLNYQALHKVAPTTPSSAVVCTASYHPAPCPQP
jgi:hypothetical protein